MVLMWLASVAVAAGTTLNGVRVHSVQQEVFAYRFTSVVSSREPVTLAFNHMDGRTVFARVGEVVGDYTLQSFSPEGIERAVLVGADGKDYALKLGQPLLQPGHVACLVSMANGGWIYAGDGSQFILAGEEVRVGLDASLDVTLTVDGVSRAVPALSAVERQKIDTLWRERKMVRAEALRKVRLDKADSDAQARVDRMLAGADVPQAKQQPVAEPHVKVGRRAGFFVGTEYRYPVAFDVIPVVTRGRDGRMTLRGMSVPTRFTTRRSGMGVSVR
jgi:hypothetical protein